MVSELVVYQCSGSLTLVKEAAKAVNGQIHGLGATLEGKYLTFQGFFWRVGKGPAKINVNKDNRALHSRLKKLGKPVVRYDLFGKNPGEYESLGAASRATNISISQIRGVALGESNKQFPGYFPVWT